MYENAQKMNVFSSEVKIANIFWEDQMIFKLKLLLSGTVDSQINRFIIDIFHYCVLNLPLKAQNNWIT